MGQHRTNPVAIANAVPQERVPVALLGEGYGLTGVSLIPTMDGEGNLCVVVAAICGRQSELVPMKPVPVLLGEVAKIPLEALRKRIGQMLDGGAGAAVAETSGAETSK
jgi:hypothetical protein